MGVDLRQLRALVAVVDHGTFTDAAIALGTTQASVSRAVASLEQTLGAAVLRRSTRRVVLTPAGEQVLVDARRVLEAVAAVDRLATRPTHGDLRIGYAWSALGAHTSRLQRRWAETHPGSALTFVSCNTASAGLVEGVVEIAILRRPLTDTRFQTVQVGKEHRFAVLARTDPLARRRRVRLADFDDRVVARDNNTGTTGEHLWPHGGGPASFREVDGVEDFLTTVAAGQAIGITTEATRFQHQRGDLVFRPLVDAPTIPVLLGWWSGRTSSDVKELTALLRSLYGNNAPP